MTLRWYFRGDTIGDEVGMFTWSVDQTGWYIFENHYGRVQVLKMPTLFEHARDIPDEVFLRAVERAKGVWARDWAMRSDVERVLGGLPVGKDAPWVDEVPGVPAKVVLAKARRVMGRGLMTGCDCGCRGDFELTDKGRELLQQ